MAASPTRSELDALIAALGDADDFARERAIARLTLAGQPTARRMAELVTDEGSPPRARSAALLVLSGIGGPDAARAAAAAALSADQSVACEALAALGPMAQGRDRDAVAALDRLTAVVLDRSIGASRRRAALLALEGLPQHLLAPIRAALAEDPSAPTDSCSGLLEAADENLPLTAERLGALLAHERDGVSATLLCRLVDLVRQKEGTETGERAAAWITVRGQLHDALAAQRSAIALYDLRETLERATGPLPIGFLAAAAVIGDLGCLDAVVASWVRVADSSADAWYCDRLVDVFRTIARREGLTRDHGAIRRIVGKHPTAIRLAAEVPARRPRRRPDKTE